MTAGRDAVLLPATTFTKLRPFGEFRRARTAIFATALIWLPGLIVGAFLVVSSHVRRMPVRRRPTRSDVRDDDPQHPGIGESRWSSGRFLREWPTACGCRLESATYRA